MGNKLLRTRGLSSACHCHHKVTVARHRDVPHPQAVRSRPETGKGPRVAAEAPSRWQGRAPRFRRRTLWARLVRARAASEQSPERGLQPGLPEGTRPPVLHADSSVARPARTPARPPDRAEEKANAEGEKALLRGRRGLLRSPSFQTLPDPRLQLACGRCRLPGFAGDTGVSTAGKSGNDRF